MKVLPFVLAKTLGPVVGSFNLAALWGLLQTSPPSFRENAARAGFDPGPKMAEQMFQAILDRPEGLWVGKCDPQANLSELRTDDGKINVLIPELAEWVQSIDAASEEKALVPDPQFPLLLMAGRHFDYNANTIMRDPAWNDGKAYCTLLMHSSDARAIGATDEQMVRVTTDAGTEEIRLKVTETARPGHVVIPHGFGLVYQGETHGANVNRLTKNTHRDRLAATPLHRFVPCRVEPL
jgi:anaerobic selenocysteine-containing dehydrogenase